MSLCPESEYRRSLDEGDFWNYVLLGIKPGDRQDNYDPEDDPNFPELISLEPNTPCSLCGVIGACGYDEEGRPMIHCTIEEEENV